MTSPAPAAARGERAGDASGPALEVPKRERAAFPDERGGFGLAPRGGFEQRGEVLASHGYRSGATPGPASGR